MFFFLGIDVKIFYGVLTENISQKKRVGMHFQKGLQVSNFKVHILSTIL